MREPGKTVGMLEPLELPLQADDLLLVFRDGKSYSLSVADLHLLAEVQTPKDGT